MIYLWALLAAVAVTFTDASACGVVFYKGGPWVGGAVGVGLGVLLLFRNSIQTYKPGIWPLVGLALARTISAVVHGSGYEFALVAWTGPIAYLVIARDPAGIPRTLRQFGIGLVGVQLLMLGMGYLINRNLIAHLLLISLAACLSPDTGNAPRPVVTIMISLALISTLSKGAAIGAVAMLAWWWGRAWILAAAPPTVYGLWLLRPWGSVQWRLDCWAATWRKIQIRPALGWGPGTFPIDHAMAAHAHNGLLNLLLWDGVLGLALLGAGCVVSLEDYKSTRNRTRGWALAGLFGVGIHYLVDDFSGCALCVAMLASLLAGIVGQSDAQPGR